MFDFIRRLWVEFVWSIGWGYIADRDAAPYILPIRDEDENNIPDHIEEPEAISLDAYPNRWDGYEGSPDYTNWMYQFDGTSWSINGYRNSADCIYDDAGNILPNPITKKQKAYMTVRPLVCAGYSNAQIKAKTGKSSSWVDSYASDVRQALKMRYDSDNLTPPLSRVGGAETLEFT